MDFSQAMLASNDVAKISAAIYKLEGGNKTKYPYGVRSINTGGDVSKAKRICENTIRNNFVRWQKAGRKENYLDFLAGVYCPKSSDPKGYINWRRNIRAMIK